jgi:hypothetical protein
MFCFPFSDPSLSYSADIGLMYGSVLLFYSFFRILFKAKSSAKDRQEDHGAVKNSHPKTVCYAKFRIYIAPG